MNLAAHLNALESAGLIHPTGMQPELEYLFRHALIHEAAYDSLLKQERRRLHRAVGEILEQAYPDRLEELAPILGEHFDRGGDDERALSYFTRAGELALRRYALAEAVAHYTRAMQIAERCRAPAAALYRARALAYDTQGDFELARADHEAALWMARAAADRRGEWQALVDLGLLWASRDYGQCGHYYRRALEVARTIGDRSTLAHTLNRIGNWHLNVEEPRQARGYHAEALAIFTATGDRHAMAQTLDLLGMASLLGSDLMAAREYYGQAIALFRDSDDRLGLAGSLVSLTPLAPTYQTQPMLSPAADSAFGVKAGEEALRVAREIGWRSGEAYILVMLADRLGPLGDYARALDSALQGLHLATEIEHHQWAAAAHCILGFLYLDLLAPPVAREHVEQALALAKRIGSLHWIRCAAGLVARSCILQGELDRAESVLHAAMDPAHTFETLGQRQVGLALVELALARADAERALQLVDQLLLSAPNLTDRDQGAIPRLALLRGAALHRLRRLDEAEAALLAARRRSVEQGAGPLLWRVHAALANLYDGWARRDEAGQHSKAALTIVTELAPRVPDDALRETFRTGALALMPPAFRSHSPLEPSG